MLKQILRLWLIGLFRAMPKNYIMEHFCQNSWGIEAVNCFRKKNVIIYIWEGSNYASLAVSFSCIVNKITCEDTEAEVHKDFFQKSFGNFTRKTPALESLFKKDACLRTCNFIKKRLQRRCFPVKFAKFLRAPFLQKASGGCFLR